MDFANTRAFEGKRVFLTGHTGFKGSWLALWLHSLGAEVTGYSLDPPTETNHFTVAGIESVIQRHHVADIRDEETLNAAMQEANPDLVMHLAAQTVVRTGYDIPRETFDVNVMGTIGVLDAIRAMRKPCAALMVTSDKCYENVEQVWGYREEDALGEHDPYGGLGSKKSPYAVTATHFFQLTRLRTTASDWRAPGQETSSVGVTGRDTL